MNTLRPARGSWKAGFAQPEEYSLAESFMLNLMPVKSYCGALSLSPSLSVHLGSAGSLSLASMAEEGSLRKSPLGRPTPLLSSFPPPLPPPSKGPFAPVRLSEPSRSRSPFVFALTPLPPSLPPSLLPYLPSFALRPVPLNHRLYPLSPLRCRRPSSRYPKLLLPSLLPPSSLSRPSLVPRPSLPLPAPVTLSAAEVYALCLIFHLFLSKGGALPGRVPKRGGLHF